VGSTEHIVPRPMLINIARYLIHARESAAYKSLISSCQANLQDHGCCRLPAFITPEGIARLKAEALPSAEAVLGNQRGRKVNCYYTQAVTDLAPKHPVNVMFDRNFGVIRDDMLPPSSTLRAVYEDDQLKDFIADVLGLPFVYRSRDAYQGLTINVMTEGESLHWHFDCNSFAITLGIQEPAAGGELEFVPNIGRQNFEAIEATYYDLPKKLPSYNYKTQEGELIFFRGGESLHRVKPVEGSRMRLVAALQYHVTDDAFDRPDMTERIYGVPVSEHIGPKSREWAANAQSKSSL